MGTPKATGQKNIIFLGLTSMFTDMGSQMIYPLLPQLLTSLGASATLLGLMEGVAEATAALFRGVFGRISDRLQNRKGFIWLGYGLSNFVRPIFALAGSVPQIFLLRFVERMGKAARVPARDAMLAHSAGTGRRGWAFGLHRSMDRIGSLLGPLLAGLILWLAPGNWRLVFLLSVIPGVISLVFILFLTETKKREVSAQESRQTFRASFPPVFWWLLASNAIFGLANASHAFLILKAGEAGVSLVWVPLLWAVYNAICAVSSPVFGHLSDRWSRKSILAISFLYFSGICLGFAFAGASWQIWALFAAFGVHYGLSKGIMPAFLADLLPSSNHLGAAFGLLDMVSAISLLFASLLMGILWDVYGSQCAFLTCSAFSLIALGVFVFKVNHSSSSE